MAEKHTPGPWTLNPSASGGLILVRGGGDWKAHQQTHLQILPEADARLIAAAPDLLEALTAAVPFVAVVYREGGRPTMPNSGDLLEQITALLARIDGDD